MSTIWENSNAIVQSSFNVLENMWTRCSREARQEDSILGMGPGRKFLVLMNNFFFRFR